MPLVLTVTQETNTPRRPTLMDAVKAKKKPVNVWQPAELGLAAEALEAHGGVTRIAQEGIVVKRKERRLQGNDMTALANQLLDALLAEQTVTGRSAWLSRAM